MPSKPLDPKQIIDTLGLEPHPEGGFFKRTFTSDMSCNTAHGERPTLSCIYYLLSHSQPTGHLHRNASGIMHYWQGGGSIRYTLLHSNAQLEQVIMGPNILEGERLQLWVPGDIWKASELIDGEFGLISEAVSPAFDFADHDMATAQLLEHYPQWQKQLSPLIRPSN